jgi:hypothetical protein
LNIHALAITAFMGVLLESSRRTERHHIEHQARVISISERDYEGAHLRKWRHEGAYWRG